MLASLANRPAKSVPGLVVVATVVASHVAAVVLAITGHPWLYAVAFVVAAAADVVAEAFPAVQLLFARAQAVAMFRALARELGLVVLAGVAIGQEPQFVWLALAAATATFARGISLFVRTPLSRRLREPVLTRNVALPARRDVDLERLPSPTALAALAAFPFCAGAWAVAGGPVVLFHVLVGLYVALCLFTGFRAALVMMTPKGRRSANSQLKAVNRAVNKLRPRAVLYFSGGRTSTYQVNMWLATMERIGVPVVVILREPVHLEQLAPTSLPVCVIQRSTDLMSFRLPTVRVAFYAAHVGKNIHFLREPRIKHVFIGHGESDKAASVNPVTKACDEVWVAGRAARERWHAADVGIHDEAIVEVGRPQLAGISGPQPRTGRVFSVLYAPTWEGWTADSDVSSVPGMGVALTEWLIGRPDVRLVYRPHPFTGTVSGKARRANDQIIELIRQSGRAGQLGARADDQAWAAVEDQHLVVTSEGASLFDCFNHADLLIGDISSVVPDFLASTKPYAVPNPSGRDHDEIREELASTRAAYFLDPDSSGWDAVLDAAEGDDPLRESRAALRTHLLGPVVDDPIDPWRAAVADLIARADAQWPHATREALTIDPLDGRTTNAG